MALIRVAALLAALVTAGGCRTPVAHRPALPGDELAVTVWVLDHGWHTALAARRVDVDRGLWPEVDGFPEAAFVEVAWGDRDFYVANPATASMAIKAAFASGGSVLHVVGFSAPVALSFPGIEIVALRVSRRGFDALTRFVSEEFEREEDGRSFRLQHGLYGTSSFYTARSGYHLFNTCNTWVARALQASGLPVTAVGVITAGDVMSQVRAAAAEAGLEGVR